jgi:hypothetical protein
MAYITITLTDQQKVYDAAAWLDKNHEGWALQIDASSIRMGCEDNCIGGQMGVDWYSNLTIPFKADMARLGRNPYEYDAVFAKHDELWREAVLYRQDAEGV